MYLYQNIAYLSPFLFQWPVAYFLYIYSFSAQDHSSFSNPVDDMSIKYTFLYENATCFIQNALFFRFKQLVAYRLNTHTS